MLGCALRKKLSLSVRLLRALAVVLSTLGLVTLTLTAEKASAATPPIGLGTASSYAVLAGSTITNTGPSVLNGDLGLSPGSAVTGFPPGLVNGASHTADGAAIQAQSDLTVAFVDAAGRTPETVVATELGGNTFLPGIYVGATLGLTGSMTLDAGGDPDAVFLFKSNSTLITASDSSVLLIGGADSCNVFWLVNSSATLGSGTDFVGTILALTSITAGSGADVDGRLLARNGAVTLDDNVITRPLCEALPPGTTTSTTIDPGSSTTIDPGTTTSSSTTIDPGTTTTTIDSGSPTTTTDLPSITLSRNDQPTPDRSTGTATRLARTGSDLGTAVGLGLLTLGCGSGILALRRRSFLR